MLRLSINEKLLIRPITPLNNWSYTLVNLTTLEEIQQESGITDRYKLASLSSSVFSEHENNTIKITVKNSLSEIESEENFILSGIQTKKQSLDLLMSLLGENCIRKSLYNTDYQEGYEIKQYIELYSDSGLSDKIDDLTWNREFLKNFIPDQRFQTSLVYQKESE